MVLSWNLQNMLETPFPSFISKNLGEIPIFGTFLAKIQFCPIFSWKSAFSGRPCLKTSLWHHMLADFQNFGINGKGRPSLYYGTTHSYFGHVNLKFIGVVTTPLRKMCYRKYRRKTRVKAKKKIILAYHAKKFRVGRSGFCLLVLFCFVFLFIFFLFVCFEISVWTCKNIYSPIIKQYPQVKVNINCTINHHFESLLLFYESSQFSRSTASNRTILLMSFFLFLMLKKKKNSLGSGLILGTVRLRQYNNFFFCQNLRSFWHTEPS